MISAIHCHSPYKGRWVLRNARSRSLLTHQTETESEVAYFFRVHRDSEAQKWNVIGNKDVDCFPAFVGTYHKVVTCGITQRAGGFMARVHYVDPLTWDYVEAERIRGVWYLFTAEGMLLFEGGKEGNATTGIRLDCMLEAISIHIDSQRVRRFLL